MNGQSLKPAYAMPATAEAASEVQREVNRLDDNTERLGNLISDVWSRLSLVLPPPTEAQVKAAPAPVESVVNSSLGLSLRSQSLRTEGHIDSLSRLLQALCI